MYPLLFFISSRLLKEEEGIRESAHTPQKMTGSEAQGLTLGTWVAWYSSRLGPCVAQVALVSDDGWSVVALREPDNRYGLPVWVPSSGVRVL